MIGKENNIRYLGCRICQEEFSERKNTPLWRSKIPESRAVSIAEHLSEGNGTKATARLTRSAECTVARRNGTVGRLPHVQYRTSRTAAHVQIVKHRQGSVAADVTTTDWQKNISNSLLRRRPV